MAASSFNKSIRILLFTNGLVLLSGAMLTPIYAIYVERIGGDLLDASITGGIFSLFAALTSFLIGRRADKTKNAELIMILGYVLMGISFLLYIWVNSIIQLFLLQIVLGFSIAICDPIFDCMFTKHMEKKNSGKVWGSWESMNYLATSFGAITGGFIITNFGFNAAFVAMAALCFSSAFFVWLKREHL